MLSDTNMLEWATKHGFPQSTAQDSLAGKYRGPVARRVVEQFENDFGSGILSHLIKDDLEV
jgi:hypothetical protein